MLADDLTIRAVTARAVDLPLERPMRTASGFLPTAPLVLVDVATEEGVTGSAYVFAYTPRALRPMVDFLANVEDMVKGESVSPRERARDFEAAFRLLGRQGLVGMALAGLDMALWDAFGRGRNLPVATLLGGAPKPIKAYDSYGVVDPMADRAALEESLAQGFQGLKLKIGVGDLKDDVAAVAGVREIIGPDIALMVDYNQSLDVAEAIRRIQRLAEYDLHWVEEPVPAEDLAGHAQVRAQSSVPIQTGENWWFPEGMALAIAAGASDYAMLDVMKIGGMTGWLCAMTQAEAASLPVSSHAFVEASAHALAVTPTAHWLEYLNKAAPLLEEPADLKDGFVTARGPGLGMRWNEEVVARHLV